MDHVPQADFPVLIRSVPIWVTSGSPTIWKLLRGVSNRNVEDGHFHWSYAAVTLFCRNIMARMALPTGTKLGPYEIQSPLGAGGMGEVYRARDASLKRDVAIKVLPAYWSRDPERLRRFEQEAQAAAALNHPNIVSIFHIGEHEDSPYIVTELLHGETLRDRLRRSPMRLRESLDLALQVVRGLAAAHDAGIVHRDLKPENLFLVKDGRVKILDFGLAKLDQAKSASIDGETISVREYTSPGLVLGTVGYMSPEQIRAQRADARSDIFAVGVILYEMLTGKRAFQKATSAETMSAILNEDPPAVSQSVSSLPPGLEKIVNRCLAKSPEQRFQHASDLAFALEALSDSSSVIAPAIKPMEAWGQKWLWIAAALAIAIALFLWWKLPAAVPVVESVTQLTDDGKPKLGRLITDGSRIYFSEGAMGSIEIVQVAVTGGTTSVIPTRFAEPRIVGLTREGSALLAITPFPLVLWKIPLPTGEPRRLGTIEAEDADFFPDERIVFTRGTHVYAAEKDGSNPRKLISMVGDNIGGIGEPSVSPDERRLVFTEYATGAMSSLFEAHSDGSGIRPILSPGQNAGVCCAKWTPDGEQLVFSCRRGGISDICVLPAKSGLFRRSQELVRLTNGPLSYWGMVPSRDGKQVFAIGTKRRGELVRYDGKLKQFLPFLSGISAIDPTFSRDGKWVAYATYPDHSLWRSRAGGTERLQLTYPPMVVRYPFISPDGKRVAFSTTQGEIYLIGIDGGSPQKIVEKQAATATWSPDGNLLVVSTQANGNELATYDLRSGSLSPLPSSQGLVGAQWLTQETLVALAMPDARMVTFDLRTHKRSDLVSGALVVNWAMSPDYRYFYYTTGGAEPAALRIRLADHEVETITSLKDLRRVTDWEDDNTQISVAPDGSAVFTRDIGTQEIYALRIKWP